MCSHQNGNCNKTEKKCNCTEGYFGPDCSVEVLEYKKDQINTIFIDPKTKRNIYYKIPQE